MSERDNITPSPLSHVVGSDGLDEIAFDAARVAYHRTAVGDYGTLRAAISAYISAMPAHTSEGYKLVPLISTKGMIDAWRMDQAQGRSLESSYAAMIAAEAELDSRTRELDETENAFRAVRHALELAEGRLSLLLEAYPDESDKIDHPTATWYVLAQVRAALATATEDTTHA